jgi:hypothetical protein
MRPGPSRLSRQMIQMREEYSLHPIGHIRSTLRALDEAPRQGAEGAPDAWLEVDLTFARGLFGIAPGDEVIVVTWLHRAERDVLEVHPRGDPESPLAGVERRRWQLPWQPAARRRVAGRGLAAAGEGPPAPGAADRDPAAGRRGGQGACPPRSCLWRRRPRRDQVIAMGQRATCAPGTTRSPTRDARRANHQS